jgi:hypothetical protein
MFKRGHLQRNLGFTADRGHDRYTVKLLGAAS